MADAPDEAAPSIETPAADDIDALVTVPGDPAEPPAADLALPTTDTSTVLDDNTAADSSIGQVLGGVTTGPLPDELTTGTTATDDAPVGQVLDGVTVGSLPDEVTTTPAAGDSVTALTDDLSIAPLPDAVTSATDDDGLAALGDTLQNTSDTGLAALGDTLQDATGDSGLAALGDTLQTTSDSGLAAIGDTLQTTSDSGLAAIGETLQDATGDNGLAALGDTLQDTSDTGLAALGETLQDAASDGGLAALGDTLQVATGDSGSAALGSLTHSIGGVTDAAGLGSVTGGLTEAGSAVVASVESSVVPQIGGTAAQIVSPLTTSVDSLDGSLGDTVAAVTAPFAVTVPAVQAQPSPVSAGEAGSPAAGGDSSTDGSVTSGTHALVDGAAVSAAPATTAPGADLLVDPVPAFGPVLPGAADPVLHLDPTAPTALDPAAPTAFSGSPIDQPGSAVDAPGILVGPVAPGSAVLPDPAMADPLSPADSALAAIAEVAPDVRVLVSAAVLAMAAAAMVGPRASGSGTDVSMVFTNVRLLPCVVKESLARHVEMLTELVGADGGSGAAAVSQAAGLGSASGTQGAGAKWSPSPAERVHDALDAAARAFRDGVEQAIADEREDVGEGFRDSRLMMQLGMLLGFVYVGFLSVWFWATRLRGTDRRRHYVR